MPAISSSYMKERKKLLQGVSRNNIDFFPRKKGSISTTSVKCA